jgi:hypothetical protein
MNIILYIVMAVLLISAIVIRRDTRELIRKSDAIQKSLNKFIERETKS